MNILTDCSDMIDSPKESEVTNSVFIFNSLMTSIFVDDMLKLGNGTSEN